MHMTRLHKQIVNRVGLIVIALAFLVTASCIGIMSWLYLKTDAEQVSAELTKVELLLQNERDGLSRAVNDYAVWDDAYDYVSKPNRKFETDNFTQQSLNVMQLDFVAIMAAPGKTLFSSEINPAYSNITATPAIHTPLLWSLLAKLPDWQQRNGEKMQSTYLTAANGRPLLLAVSGIFDSSLEQPHSGLMIFGRYLDGTYLQRLQQLAESQLQISAQMPVQKITAPLYHTEQTASKR